MIKEGFMVRITSWENDGDYYNTKTFDGLDTTQTRNLVAFCKFLQKVDRIKCHDVQNIDFSKFEYFNCYYGFSGWDFEATQDYFEELAYEILGCTEYGMRVLEQFDVHFIEKDIPDLTTVF
jgi:hypothetical protein